MTGRWHLVVQGPNLDPRHLRELAQYLDTNTIEPLSATAARFRNVERSADVADYCRHNRLDAAYVPTGTRLADFGVFVTDMDSTLIDIECIDELADLCGRKTEVSAITDAAMRGEIDFAESLRRRVALLAGMDQGALDQVYAERLGLRAGAPRLIAELKRAGLHTVLVSGGFTYFTERLRTRLGFDEAHANALEIVDGRVTGRVLGAIVDGAAKRRALEQACSRLGLAPGQAVACGDGANDCDMLAAAGIGIGYRAKPALRAVATFNLDHSDLDGILNLFEGAGG
ncbi:MAG: hypothetical protein IOMNBAOH_00704 [Rhodocyclaceae bacterium]|nr:phosphoserine phosphatase SerB [Rhodocyclaceae bacterium]MCG3186150.1 hypothetical protein [Rhodocyclaceae bacterium]